MKKLISFQDIIFQLQQFWQAQGCSIIQPYDLEMGAATFHPVMVLHGLSSPNLRVAFVQPSRRPTDSRRVFHPNRLERYYQFQVVLKPVPDNIQKLYLNSLSALGIFIGENDLLFSEDDWESPSLGASGLGWEVLLNGSEISQFTYMQQIAGIGLKPIVGEITYGLERLALHIQDKLSISDIIWSNHMGKNISYSQVHFMSQKQFIKFNTECADVKFLEQEFLQVESIVQNLLDQELPLPAYDYAIKASHIFNLLDSRAALGRTDKAVYISRIRTLVKFCCSKWMELVNRET